MFRHIRYMKIDAEESKVSSIPAPISESPSPTAASSGSAASSPVVYRSLRVFTFDFEREQARLPARFPGPESSVEARNAAVLDKAVWNYEKEKRIRKLEVEVDGQIKIVEQEEPVRVEKAVPFKPRRR